ncbi:MAG: hypothetical protein PHQ94_05940 [Syntrophomonas sp.]|nr:hypothetical protein [Syntrophomonas sp.]
MEEQDRLLMKKHELEQLIMDNQERYLQSSYASHPADLASHLQVLNIELERINEALAQDNPEQLS